MTDKFNWGIIGTGAISAKFAVGLKQVQEARLLAAASLSGKNPYHIRAERYYNRYEQLCEDPEIDAIYIGNIHSEHYKSVKLCLDYGKPVLCEKPITINSRECSDLIHLARQKDTFLMEAMWTRFLPGSKKIQEICSGKRYGAVKSITITFGYPGDPAKSRLFNPELGGGALLDLGIYGINYANMLLNEHPGEIKSWSDIKGGVDFTTSVQLKYKSGCIADMMFSIDRRLRNEAYIITEEAEFSIPFFWRSEKIYQYKPNQAFEVREPVEVYDYPVAGNGYEYEAAEVGRCVRDGKIESSLMSHENTLKIMETMDQVRSQCGISYPQDNEAGGCPA